MERNGVRRVERDGARDGERRAIERDGKVKMTRMREYWRKMGR